MQDKIVSNIILNLKKHKHFSYSKPSLSGDSWLISQIASIYNKKIPIVIFTSNQLETIRLMDEIKLFFIDANIKYLDNWETLPYEAFSPSKNIVSNRLKTLYSLMNNETDILILSISTAMHRLCPPEFLAKYTFYFKIGNKLNIELLKNQLIIANYIHTKKVIEQGEFCIRGNIVDIFPMGSIYPYRIDLFDNIIETIYTFDIETQRSIKKIEKINILPGHEFPLDNNSKNYFRTKLREEFSWNPSKTIPYTSISDNNNFPGIEYYLTLFFENTSTIFDYINKNSLCIVNDDIKHKIIQFLDNVNSRYEFLKNNIELPALKPSKVFLQTQEFIDILYSFKLLIFENINNENIKNLLDKYKFSKDIKDIDIIKKIDEITKEGKKIIFSFSSERKYEIYLKILNDYNIDYEEVDSIKKALNSKKYVILSKLNIYNSFYLKHLNIIFVSEYEIFNKFHKKNIHNNKDTKKINYSNIYKDISEIQIGHPIVHIDYGVGLYNGMVHVSIDNQETEFLKIEYANKNNLYVPIQNLNKISRYQGLNEDSLIINNLGTDRWKKSKLKAEKQIKDIAAELLSIYSERSIKKGFQFKIPDQDYKIFCDSFGFEETPDQLSAIDSILQDMQSEKPMDRLICGDVGFGKTEIALRAAFVAVANNKQVAILCPTTLLAEQHMETFTERFANWPVNIIELSRFKTLKENQETISKINKGQVDIIIGTHKLLSKKIKFQNLGLLIIDEEHRFGVAQKETLKELKKDIDIITLTATPIPRTLSMTLEGIKDFSIISTPPKKRLSIKTFIRKNYKDNIKEALTRELNRGGQIYFVHNDIDTIYAQQSILKSIMPEIKIGIVHGKLPEKELEYTMQGFYRQKYDVLLCTTIIENGIDIPNANTIIINRADKLGLAQLHQLRGRVGRSHHQAYAYLIVPDDDQINKKAQQRLDVIKNMENLGSGFYLAIHDLEIRGSGQILGDSQSGNIQEIGLYLYNEMLDQSIKDLQNTKSISSENILLTSNCEVNLNVPTLISENYCNDVSSRLSIYKRLSDTNNLDGILEIKYELIDRFGKIPEYTNNLLFAHQIRILGDKLGILKINLNKNKAIIQISESNIDSLSTKIIKLISFNKEYNLNFKKDNKIEILLNNENLKLQVNYICNFLEKLYI
ncbi:Transcription-repair-coupling factor [Candidatus Kinetoplastibacterium sorsogonicusi]|uniref:Transcription-repair-coupling factor n=1 Tax=Candidatus Kinetoplastidibacterium kentomonadis TaxID=1576550 RepID=A0A3S7JA78_9PROT|nr:transcription-repair coupling factor [Candidatus Kinetoplastibacterium sorsogonicusi]AWD32582.1 Transcription-repair-coupling factor [Candidatus Kinetoplastibacterium sorsogonicusi]